MYATNGTAQSSADLTMLAAIANGQRGRRGHCAVPRVLRRRPGNISNRPPATFLSVETGQKFATNFCQIIVIVWPSGWRSRVLNRRRRHRRRAVELVAAGAHGRQTTTDAPMRAVMGTATSSPTGTTTSSDRASTFTKRGTVTKRHQSALVGETRSIDVAVCHETMARGVRRRRQSPKFGCV